MKRINIEYLKTDLIEEEFEIEQFWMDIRKEILLVQFRQHCFFRNQISSSAFIKLQNSFFCI